MYTKIGKFDKLPPGQKDSVPAETISKTRPVGEDNNRQERELARRVRKRARDEENDVAHKPDSDRSDVSLQAVRQFIRDRLHEIERQEAEDEAEENTAPEKPVLSEPLTVQSRAAVAYRLAQQAAPGVELAKRNDNLPVEADEGLDDKSRLERELARVETLQAAGYDRIPVSAGQTFLEALEMAYTALEA